jgi:hypothetical protein
MLSAVSELCQNPICFGCWGELSSEKQMPQVIVNKEKWKEEIEGLELSRRLAKQVPLPGKGQTLNRNHRSISKCFTGTDQELECNHSGELGSTQPCIRLRDHPASSNPCQ